MRRLQLHRVRAWVRHPDFSIHAAILAIVGLLWGFMELAEVVREPNELGLDRRILLALREPNQPANPIGPRWLESAWLDVTALGSGFLITLLTAMVVGFLAVQLKWRAAALILVAVVGGALLSFVLKAQFARPRPDVVAHLAKVSSASFPSGHSLISAVVYPTLGALLASLSVKRRVKIYLLAVALLLTLLIGVSRIYLGVHYPSDVLAGWVIGLAWSLACWAGSQVLQRRGALHGEKLS